ncbi:MAG: hypothetical protein LBS89_08035, partial [Zoogloeaceae bacterium]|nr:hypothetical protein [Zoogloeaceae bacterium]
MNARRVFFCLLLFYASSAFCEADEKVTCEAAAQKTVTFWEAAPGSTLLPEKACACHATLAAYPHAKIILQIPRSERFFYVLPDGKSVVAQQNGQWRWQT